MSNKKIRPFSKDPNQKMPPIFGRAGRVEDHFHLRLTTKPPTEIL